MKTTKKILISFLLLLPAISATSLIVWRSFSDPTIVKIANFIFYGFVSILFSILLFFTLAFIVNCVNKVFKIVFGKSVIVANSMKNSKDGQ